jgi:hypothetical protein
MQFFDVVNTGSYRSVVESDEKMLDYIAAVKEKLLAGEKIIPIPGINHQLFVKEIQSLLCDIDMTSDPASAPIIKNITDLINGHMEILRNGDQVSALIYSGALPTPPAINNNELIKPAPPAGAMGPPPPMGGSPPEAPAEPLA